MKHQSTMKLISKPPSLEMKLKGMRSEPRGGITLRRGASTGSMIEDNTPCTFWTMSSAFRGYS